MKISSYSISVVIPTHNDFSQLLFVIKGVNEQIYKPKENLASFRIRELYPLAVITTPN